MRRRMDAEITNQITPEIPTWLRYNLTFISAVVNSSTFPSSMLMHNCLYAIHEKVVLPLWTMYLVHLFSGRISGFRARGEILDFDGPQNLQSTLVIITSHFETFSILWRLSFDKKDKITIVIQRSLSAALVILTLSFFVLMMVETRLTENRAQIWKSSLLAFIYHGLEAHNELHDSLFLEDINDMEYAVKRIQVRLATTTQGIKLVSVKDERLKERSL